MFIAGISVGIGLFFLSLLYLNASEQKPSKLVGGIIALLSWLVSGSLLMDGNVIFTRLYIASIPIVFYLLLPLIVWYQQVLTAYGAVSKPNIRPLHWVPIVPAGLLSLSIGFMPAEDFNTMFFEDSETVSVWVSINSAGFALLLLGWAALSFYYLVKIVIDTRAYHQQLQTEFANHEGKRLDWLVALIGFLVFTWCYALVVLGLSANVSTPLISETFLSLLVLVLIWVFAIQALNRKPAFINSEPAPVETVEAKYSNSSIDDERLKRIAGKVERKVMEEKLFLDPDLDASTLAGELGISVHYLSQVLSQEMETTFYNYINDARIDAAKVELKTSESTVLEIALAVGFNTRSAFYNAFKKRTGMTPSKFKTAAEEPESVS